MGHIMRDGLLGLGLGIAGGILGAIILSSKKRSESTTADFAGAASSAAAAAKAWWPQATGERGGLLPDEQITDRLRSQLDRQGTVAPRVDVTTIDGVVY